MTARVETVAIGDDYCAVFRRANRPDEFLVGADGKPVRFATSSAALRAGRKALAIEETPSIAPDDHDVFGILAWRARRDDQIREERVKIFGTGGPATIERNGRTIIVERKRLR